MKKQILIGTDCFDELIENNFFYVDKTLFIKELLEKRGKATLITRPRRFGKTMNMWMLDTFFDIRRDTKHLFEGLKIMEHEDIINKYLNKFPTIFLSLKGVEEPTYNEVIGNVKSMISEIFQNNMYLLESDKLNDIQKQKFLKFCEEKENVSELKKSLKFLTECLYIYHQKRTIVLFDEYDVPLDNANNEGFYPKMIKFMRGFMGQLFKSNKYLEFGVLTGCIRISKEGLFSSFNNPVIRGLMDKDFSTCFGFTEEEVKESCKLYDLENKYDEVKKWYNGYRFGGIEMYNPWSIANYLQTKEFDIYWVNTGSTNTLQEMFYKGDENLRNDLAGLLTDIPIQMSLEDTFTYPIDNVSSNKFWSLFLYAGYIKPCNGAKKGKFYAELVNYEIKHVFSNYAEQWLSKIKPNISKIVVDFVSNLLKGDVEKVSEILNKNLLKTPSYHDFKVENSYHMFIFGILIAVAEEYSVVSNQESGEGRSDCMIRPYDKNKYAAVIEFKHETKASMSLKQIAIEGLNQIENKSYIRTLKNEGYDKIYKYSIAFYKKKCEVVMCTNGVSSLIVSVISDHRPSVGN